MDRLIKEYRKEYVLRIDEITKKIEERIYKVLGNFNAYLKDSSGNINGKNKNEIRKDFYKYCINTLKMDDIPYYYDLMFSAFMQVRDCVIDELIEEIVKNINND